MLQIIWATFVTNFVAKNFKNPQIWSRCIKTWITHKGSSCSSRRYRQVYPQVVSCRVYEAPKRLRHEGQYPNLFGNWAIWQTQAFISVTEVLPFHGLSIFLAYYVAHVI